MGFESLLGNARLKENLQRSIRSGRTSHFYLISGPAGSGKRTLARLLAAALQCQGAQKPCLGCTACRKVMAYTHPDYITVTDPEHKNVAVRIVRAIRDDMFIRPNEGQKKIYLFPQEMGVEGQNALLKVLEEPPSYGVFILLSENPEQLLPTVRSRAVELSLGSLSRAELLPALKKAYPDAGEEALEGAVFRSGGYLGQALQLLQEGGSLPPQTEAFANCFARKDVLELVQLLASMEKWKRDTLLPQLSQWSALLQQALLCHSGMPAATPLARQLAAARSPLDLNRAIASLSKADEYLRGNVSPGAVCGWLSWELR